MGKSYFFMQDAWQKHAEQVVLHDGIKREGEPEYEVEKAGGRQRLRYKDSSLGLETTDVHYKGDRVVVEGEIRHRDGSLTQVVHRYGDDGRFRGSREITWEKTGERQHTQARDRRIYG